MVENQEGEWVLSDNIREADSGVTPVRKEVHKTIKKVTEDIESMSFNTAISKMMECVNAMYTALKDNAGICLADYVSLLHVLNPYAPHLTEELYSILQQRFASLPACQLCRQTWPTWNPEYLVENTKEIVIQVNGKLRDKITVAADAPKEEVEAAALASPRVQEHTAGKTIRKVIVVPGRLVNIVAN